MSFWCCGIIMDSYTKSGRFEPFHCNDKNSANLVKHLGKTPLFLGSSQTNTNICGSNGSATILAAKRRGENLRNPLHVGEEAQALIPKADVTRMVRQKYQWSQKKDLFPFLESKNYLTQIIRIYLYWSEIESEIFLWSLPLLLSLWYKYRDWKQWNRP